MQHILVIHTGNLGDVVSGSVVVRLLLQKYARIHVFIRASFYGLFSGEPSIKEVCKESELQNQYFDIVVDLDSSAKSRKLMRLIRYGYAWGLYAGWFRKIKYKKLYDTQLPKHSAGHIVRDYYPLFHALGGIGSPLPRIPVIPDADLALKLEHFRVDAKGLIGLHIHASNAVRSLPLNLVINTMRDLHQKGFALALIAVDKNDVNEILHSLNFPVFYQSLSIARLKTLLLCLEHLIACDSGPLHLAAALGCKATGVYGPSMAKNYASTNIHVVEKVFPCRPCNQNKPCPYQRRCLQSITSQELTTQI